jgi:hypothetical protein
MNYQNKLIRFIENHDEPRAAATFSPEKERVAAVVIATTPGAKLFHEGQFEGRHVRPPVFLGRRPFEPTDQSLQSFYYQLLQAIKSSQSQDGEWKLGSINGWPDNQSYRNILTWTWQNGNRDLLIAVNFSDWRSQGIIHVPWRCAERPLWRLVDLLSNEVFQREGRDLDDHGLYVDLRPWQYHVLQFE